METGEFQGRTGRYVEDSEPWWPPFRRAPEGSPNVLLVVLDDVGFAQLGCFGSDIATPTFDRLAEGGLRYANFHTTALCSPTRACLLTGRNHHTCGMGRVAELATGFPGYDSRIPRSCGFLPRDAHRPRVRGVRGGEVAPHPRRGPAHGAPARPLAARPGLRALVRVPRRRDEPVRPDALPRQPLGPAAEVRGGRLPPERGPGRPGHRVPRPTCATPTPTSPGSPTSRPARATRRTTRRPSGSSATAGTSTAAGTRGARPGWPARSSSACCPTGTDLSPRPEWVPAWDSLSEQTQRRLRPLHGGVRRLPVARRRAGRPGDRLARGVGPARRHRGARAVRQRRVVGGRAEGVAQRRPHVERPAPQRRARRPSGSTRSAGPGSTTTTRGAGRSPATRRSSGGSGRPTRAAWPTR